MTFSPYIHTIVQAISDNNLSIIVGAGFSKNISPLYLSWKQLLHDMIVEMYKDEQKAWGASDDELIGKYGYLGIASEYVRRKGYHEAIDHYIDLRTPILAKDGSHVNLKMTNDYEEKDVDVSLHQSLLSLGARSIYTFNYDNALDVNDEKILTQEEDARLSELTNGMNEIRGGLRYFEEKFSQIPESPNDPSSGGVTEGYKVTQEFIDELNKHLFVSDVELDKHEYVNLRPTLTKNINTLQSAFRQKESEWLRLKNQTKDKYVVVKDSKSIAQSGDKRCIFKLHGSVQNDYEFDGDKHLQYIICQEDYNSYLAKHEAFVDLMRISLLRENFLIIGFSCDDPNFLLWMNWVKDINDKNAGNKGEEKFKYYINVNNEELDPDKLAMLSHHGIIVIDLFKSYDSDNSKKDELKEKDERKERQKAFLSEIYNSAASRSNSLDVWDMIDYKNAIKPEYRKLTYDDDIVGLLSNKAIRFPKVSFYTAAHHYLREGIISNLPQVLKEKTADPTKFAIVLKALDEENWPFYALMGREIKDLAVIYNQIQSDKILTDSYDAYESLCAHLMDKQTERESKGLYRHGEFIEIIDDLKQFKFKEARQALDKWTPQDTYGEAIKVLLNNAFGFKTYHDDDIEALYEKIKVMPLPQQRFTALDLLLRFHPSPTWSTSPDNIFNIIADDWRQMYKRDSRLIRIRDFVQRIENEGSPKSYLEPLGSVVRRINFGSANATKIAADQLIMAFAKSGIFPAEHNAALIDKNHWLVLSEAVYKAYPSYVLLSSLMYGDKDLTARIAQLYCYTNDSNLRRWLSTVFLNVMNCLESNDLQPTFEDTLYLLLRYLLKVVPSDVWVKHYKAMLKSKGWIDKKVERLTNEINFAIRAIYYINDERLCQTIIRKCLKKDRGITDIQNRFTIAASKKLVKLYDSSTKLLAGWMSHTETAIQAFVIFNLRRFISKKDFHAWLSKIPDDLLRNQVVLEACCGYVGNADDKLIRKFYSFVLRHPSLWGNGIKDNEKGETWYTDETPFTIERYDNIPPDIAIEIYKKMAPSFQLISKVVQKGRFDDFFMNWNDLLESMLIFMEKNKKALQSLDGYSSKLNDCMTLISQVNHSKTISMRLLSENGYEVETAVIQLFHEAELYGANRFLQEYHLLVNTILLHSTKALDVCFEHLVWAIQKHIDFFTNNDFVNDFQLILTTYQPYFVGDENDWTIEGNKDTVEKYLLELRDWLEARGCDAGEWKGHQPVYQHIAE